MSDASRLEILTLEQTGKIARGIPVVLYGPSYWTEIIDFEALARHGMISPEDLQLFSYADDPRTALSLLQRAIAPHVEPAKAPNFAHSRPPPSART